MKDIKYRNTGILVGIAGIVLVAVMYLMLGTVDLVYTNGEREVYRQENVRVISKIEDPMENMSEEFITGDDMKFTYTSGNKTETFNPDEPGNIKGEIVKTLATSLVSFDWSEDKYVITINVK